MALQCSRALRWQAFRSLLATAAFSLLLMAAGVSSALAAVASPKAVILYPQAAQLTVEEVLPLKALPGGGKGIVLTLPPHADRQSFSLTLTGGQVSGIIWQEGIASDADQAKPGTPSLRGQLLAELAAARVEQGKISAYMNVSRKRIELLNESGTERDTKKGVEEVEKLDALLARQLPALMLELQQLVRTGDALDQRIAKAEQQLQVLGGEEPREQTATVTIDGTAGPVTARYSYMLPGCGWTPAYTLEALPDKNLVVLTQEADLSQNTLVHWENADISVATNTPDNRPAPGRLPAWVLRAGQPPSPMPAQSIDNSMLRQSTVKSEMKPQADTAMAAPRAPVREEKTTFALWRIGKRSIPAGNQVRVTLAREEWKAEYSYTVRPMLDPRGFLTAAATPGKAVDMPTGPAVFKVDGTVIGTSPIALHGNTLKLYFGVDPLITAEMRNTQRQSGESGIISKERTITWNWSVAVKNGRAKPAVVQVEDPSPIAQDEAIKLEVTSTPKPELNNQAFTWRLPLQAGETKTITHVVKATAPKDMQLSPGR